MKNHRHAISLSFLIVALTVAYFTNGTNKVFSLTSNALSEISIEHQEETADRVTKFFLILSGIKGIIAVVEDVEVTGNLFVASAEIEIGNIFQSLKEAVDFSWKMSAVAFMYTKFLKYGPTILLTLSNDMLVPFVIFLLVLLLLMSFQKAKENRVKKIKRLLLATISIILIVVIIFPVVGTMSQKIEKTFLTEIQAQMDKLETISKVEKDMAQAYKLGSIDVLKSVFNSAFGNFIDGSKSMLKNIMFVSLFFLIQAILVPLLSILFLYVIGRLFFRGMEALLLEI